VWSVGNLHWGGTGKTPVVIALASWLRAQGARVAILSRGYGRSGVAPCLVSRGEGPLGTPAETGDEPWLLAEQLPGVAVAVASRRADAARLVLAEVTPAPDLFLLDDGFSHLALARNLDLLVLPETDPFGGGKLPPGGRLREPLAASRRAAAVLLAGAGATAEAASAAATGLAAHGFHGTAFACPTAVGPPRQVATRHPAPPAGPLLLVTGIARPERVLAAAEEQCLSLAGHLAFRDHCPYDAATLREIELTAARTAAAGVLTTAKDRVKLAGRVGLPLFELPLAAEPEPAFWQWLQPRLAASVPRLAAGQAAPRA
jgi:tetraacyldisaccharide 4'-kinase